MGRPRVPLPGKLICGLLAADRDLLRRARQLLVRQFGPLCAESDIWTFDATDYYKEEMGADLLRQFVAFTRGVRTDELAEIKRATNAIETQIADDFVALEVARPVNLDPGCLDLARLALATTKDRAHRLYLGHGIFGEITLLFERGVWQPQPWTYPDYRELRYHEFFTAVREQLAQEREAASHTADDAPAPEPRELGE